MTANYTPAQIAEITNYWDLKQIAEAVGISHQGVKKADLQQALINHFEVLEVATATVEETQPEAPKARKGRVKGYVAELADMLCHGATKAEICEKFGWKNWSPKTSAVTKLGYSIEERESKYYAVPAGL